MARGVVGMGFHRRRIDRDPEAWVTLEIRVPPDVADRLAVVRSMTGETNGRILLPALRQRLAGIRLPSIPADLVESIRRSGDARPPESGEAGQSGPTPECEAGQDAAEPASTPPAPTPGEGRGGKKDPVKLRAALDRRKVG